MKNIFDFVENLVPTKREIKFCCKNSHLFEGDKPPKVCQGCGQHWTYRIVNDEYFLISKTLDSLLGSTCQCCNSKKHLQVAHVFGKKIRDVVPNLNEIYSSPNKFQRLCKNCWKWKNDGPCCPCKYWDLTFPGWRGSRDSRKSVLDE